MQQIVDLAEAIYGLTLRSWLPFLALMAATLNLGLSQTPVSIVSAADYRAYVAPQSQAAVLGVNLADSTDFGEVNAMGQFSTEIAGTTVQVCAEPAGLTFVSPAQINIIVPADLKPGICPVVITTNGRTSIGTADVRPLSPALFTIDGSGTGQAVALNTVTRKAAPFSVLTPENLNSGESTHVTLSGTGFRNISAVFQPGASPATDVYGTITNPSGKSWVVPVEYIGPVPGLAGVDQITIALPPALDGSGMVYFTVTVGSLRSNSVTLNIASLGLPAITSFAPRTGPPASRIRIMGANFGTPEMIAAGRIALSLKESNGVQVSLRPDYVDSSQLQFTMPSMPVDRSTLYYGPVTLCVQVDSATTCSDAFELTRPALASTVPGQTLLTILRSSLQNGVSNLNQLGEKQVAQSLSARTGSILAQYATLVNSSASGNPQVVTLHRSDGSQITATVDATFLNRLDQIAASLQPILTGAAPSPGAETRGDTLQPACLNSTEAALQATRDAYRNALSTSEAILQTAVLAPVADALSRCIDANSDGCIADANSGMVIGEVTAHLLAGLLANPLLAVLAIDTQPVFLDSIQILPATPTSQQPVLPIGSFGSALQLQLGHQADLTVQGHFVSITGAKTAHQIVQQIVFDALSGSRLPKQLGDSLANDVTDLVLNNLSGLLPDVPSVQAENYVPLTSGTLRIDPNGMNEMTISASCVNSPGFVSGLGSTNGEYEPVEFAVDPSVLLLSNEIFNNAAKGSVFSILNVAVRPGAPGLRVQTDKGTYNNREYAFVEGSGFPGYSPVAISISGASLTERIEVIAFSDGSGRLGTLIPLSAAEKSGSYRLNAIVPNSALRASASISVASAAPSIASIVTSPSPPISGQAFTFTITGIGFNPTNAIVVFNGPQCTASTCSFGISALKTFTYTQLSGTAVLPGGVFTVNVQNGSSGTASNGLTLNVSASATVAPQITTMTTTPSPPVAAQAFLFTITGTGFDPNGAMVFFNGPGCAPSTTCFISNSGLLSRSSTQLNGVAILAAGSFSVTVFNGPIGNISNALALTVAPPAGGAQLQLSGITTSPSPPVDGKAFTFTVSGSGFDPSSAMIVLSGPGCTPCNIPNSALSSATSTQLSGPTTLAAGSFTVTVQNASGMPSNGLTLTVSNSVAPQISALATTPNPPAGGQAFTMAVTGTGFDPNSVLVTFTGPGCAPCSIASNALSNKTSTQLGVSATLAPGSFTVTVQNGSTGTPSNGLSLTVSSPTGVAPKTSGLTTTPTPPVSGQAFSFSITGTGFDPTSAMVSFTGPSCTPCTIANSALTSKTSTQLNGTATLTSGNFSITVNNGPSGAPSNGQSLTVSGATTAPSVTAIVTLPNLPVAGQTFTFTINGTGFDPASAMVIFTGPNCMPCSINTTALSTKTPTQLSGMASLVSGSFTVMVQNGRSGAPSNSVPLAISGSSPGGGQITVTNAVIGQNLQAQLIITLNPPAPSPSGVTLTITSANPSLALVGGGISAGKAQIQPVLSAGTSTISTIVQALASSGTVTITLSAPGYTDAQATITLAPAGFILQGPNGTGAAFSTFEGVVTPLTVAPVYLNPDGSAGAIEQIAGGYSVNVTVSTDVPSVGTVSPASLGFSGGVNGAGLSFTASSTKAGNVDVLINSPAGFVNPTTGSQINVTVQGSDIIAFSATIGTGLETNVNASLSGPVGAPTAFTFHSNDPTKLLFSSGPTTVGTQDLTVTISTGQDHTQDVFAQAIGAAGTNASYQLSASGFSPASGTVSIVSSGLLIQSPGGFGAVSFSEPLAAGAATITVFTGSAPGGVFSAAQLVIGGRSVSVNVATNAPSVGGISSSPITISGGSGSASTLFQPAGPGSAGITASAPGFGSGTVTATITAANLVIDSGILIGQNLEQPANVNIPAPAGSGGASVTIQSNSPSLLLAVNATDPGAPQITVPIAQNSRVGTFFIYALANSGSGTYTATFPGVSPVTGTAQFTNSGFVIISTGSTAIDHTTQTSTQLEIFAALLDQNGAPINFTTQPLAGNQQLRVSIQSNSAAATVSSTVTVMPGTDHALVPVTIVSTGMATISVSQPTGFSAPNSFTSVVLNIQ